MGIRKDRIERVFRKWMINNIESGVAEKQMKRGMGGDVMKEKI